ncbi:MAG: hypothetical protein SGJ27_17280 [Candidatus Melainabacteria bacterium]|nr:hypothetical protein [Candidatus Melainabacteria bacterium]
MEKPDAIASDEGSGGSRKQSAHQALLEDALTLGTVLASTSPVDAGLKILVFELANKETSPSLPEILEEKIRGQSPSKGQNSFPNLFQSASKHESPMAMAMIGGVIKPADTDSPKTFADFNRERVIAQADLVRTLRREALLGRNANRDTTNSKTNDANSNERSNSREQPIRTSEASLNWRDDSSLNLKLTNEQSSSGMSYDYLFKTKPVGSNQIDRMVEQFRKGLSFLTPTAESIPSMSSMLSDVFKEPKDRAPSDDEFFRRRLLKESP